MDGWTLIKRTAGYQTLSGDGWVEMKSPAAIYWARGRYGVHSDDGYSRHRYLIDYEIRSPVNAAYYGSEDKGEMLSPEGSAPSGFLPVKAVRELYAETTPEELGLTVVSKI